jgi:hypothetical protein
MTTEPKRSPNPLFLALAVLSGILAALDLVALFVVVFVFKLPSYGALAGLPLRLGLVWCGGWAYLWWRMADRYR